VPSQPSDAFERNPRPIVVLYDGACGFCASSMRRWRRRTDPSRVSFVPSGRAEAPAISARTGIPDAGTAECGCPAGHGFPQGSVRVLEPRGEELVGMAAVYRIMQLGGVVGAGAALALHRACPAFGWLGNRIYAQLARQRHTISRILGLRPDSSA